MDSKTEAKGKGAVKVRNGKHKIIYHNLYKKLYGQCDARLDLLLSSSFELHKPYHCPTRTSCQLVYSACLVSVFKSMSYIAVRNQIFHIMAPSCLHLV